MPAHFCMSNPCPICHPVHCCQPQPPFWTTLPDPRLDEIQKELAEVKELLKKKLSVKKRA